MVYVAGWYLKGILYYNASIARYIYNNKIWTLWITSIYFSFFSSFFVCPLKSCMVNVMNQYTFKRFANGNKKRIDICCIMGAVARTSSKRLKIWKIEYVRSSTLVMKKKRPNRAFVILNVNVLVFPLRIMNHRNARGIELSSPMYMFCYMNGLANEWVMIALVNIQCVSRHENIERET